MKRLIPITVFASAAAFAAAPILIQNATVLTVTKGTFQGSVLIRDGKIAEVGPKIAAPGGRNRCGRHGQISDARHHRLPFPHRG